VDGKGGVGQLAVAVWALALVALVVVRWRGRAAVAVLCSGLQECGERSRR
jgi:hypothetical protein